jgi:hypothetical protein
LTRGQLNTVIVALLLIIGISINVARFFPDIGKRRPSLEVVDVRTFNDLEPVTIVHYVIRNVGKAAAYDVLTSVSGKTGNESLPAFFDEIPVGGASSVNRRLPSGQYPELTVKVLHREAKKVEEFVVEPDVEANPLPEPDFIAYNLTLYSITEDNTTVNWAMLWVVNVGGSSANDVKVSIYGGGNTALPVLEPGEAEKIILERGVATWEGVDVTVYSDEGVTQVYHITEYKREETG